MRIPRNFLPETISVEAAAGTGARGTTYSAAADVRASIQPTSRLLVTADGRQVVVEIMALVRPEEMIPVESRVTWGSRRYRVLQASPMPDSRRPSHIELLLGVFS